MAVTWEVISYEEHGELATLTIQEIVDLVPGKSYFATTNKNHERGIFIKRLRDSVKKDREKKIDEETNRLSFDLSTFESTL